LPGRERDRTWLSIRSSVSHRAVLGRAGWREDREERDRPQQWTGPDTAPGTFMVHLAVSDGTTEWAGQVTDDDDQG
jgi:hypothetical protein